MSETDITQAYNSESQVESFSIDYLNPDRASAYGETTWDSPHWIENQSYYRQNPELKQAVDALARWTAGKGYETDIKTELILRRIIGWGEDSFQTILTNMLRVKKINGDSFAEIIRDKYGILINLKPLSPNSIRIVTNKQGVIIRYEEIEKADKKTLRKFKTTEIFHLSNDRLADEIHGISIIESCKWILDARNEAMRAWRVVLDRNINPLKIFEVDEDDPTKIQNFANTIESVTKDKNNLVIPKGNATLTIPPVPLQNPESWIRYTESILYQALGVPKVILGGSQDFTEASSKVGYLTFEQVYMSEQTELEQDIYNQLGLKIKFNRPVSLKDNIQEDEAANTGQTGFQPNETQTGVTRTE